MNRFNFYHVATGFNLTTHQTYSGPVYAMNATDGYTIREMILCAKLWVWLKASLRSSESQG